MNPHREQKVKKKKRKIWTIKSKDKEYKRVNVGNRRTRKNTRMAKNIKTNDKIKANVGATILYQSEDTYTPATKR